MSGILTAIAGSLDSGAPPAATLVAHAVVGGGQDGTVPTPAIDTTGANFIVVGVSWYSGVTSDGTFSDSKGNTWTPLTSIANPNFKTRFFYCFNPTVGSGHTFSYAGSFTVPFIGASAWAGIVSSPFDDENGAFDNSATSISTGSVTASQDALVVTAMMTADATATAFAVDNGFTRLDDLLPVVGANVAGSHAYKLMAAGSVDPAWTVTGGGANEILAAAAVFKC